MRTTVLVPVMALLAVALGCGSEAGKPARSTPQRDLTLVTQAAQVEIASPVEIRQTRWVARRAPARRPTRWSKPGVAAVAVPVPTTPEPVAQPVALTPANDRELLPGKSVTVIPASSGPSTESDHTDELPPDRGRTMAGHGGGTCRGGRGRGPGIGIAAAPRPDFR